MSVYFNISERKACDCGCCNRVSDFWLTLSDETLDRLGPFATRADAEAARTTLQDPALSTRVSELEGDNAALLAEIAALESCEGASLDWQHTPGATRPAKATRVPTEALSCLCPVSIRGHDADCERATPTTEQEMKDE